MAWHTANATGNANYIGIEACQSMGNAETFKGNEQACFKLAAEILKRYGLPANRNTVMLHQEFVATSCPHRSWELHGSTLNAVKDYYITEITKYMSDTTEINSTPVPSNETQKLNQGVFKMYIYFEGEKMYGVWGNIRFYLPTFEVAKHFRNLVRDQTGKPCREYKWKKGSSQIRTTEAMTTLGIYK